MPLHLRPFLPLSHLFPQMSGSEGDSAGAVLTFLPPKYHFKAYIRYTLQCILEFLLSQQPSLKPQGYTFQCH